MAYNMNQALKQISFQINKSEIKTPELVFKTILIGPSNAGKSSLLNRYLNNTFNDKNEVTVGVDFGKMIAKINNIDVKIDLYDTAGTEKFRSVVRVFYKGTHCVYLTFDLSELGSLSSLYPFLNDIKENADLSPIIILVANKLDKKNKNSIQMKDIEEFSEKNNLDMFFEVSAKTGENVNELFENSFKRCFMKFEKRKSSSFNKLIGENNKIKIEEGSKNNSNCPC